MIRKQVEGRGCTNFGSLNIDFNAKRLAKKARKLEQKKSDSKLREQLIQNGIIASAS